MTERDLVSERLMIGQIEVAALLADLDVLRQPLPDLSLGENLKTSNTIVSGDPEFSTGDFGKVSANSSSYLLGDVPSLLRFELTFNFQIQRNLNDHKLEFISGFVLNWTHQREEITPLTGGESHLGEVL